MQWLFSHRLLAIWASITMLPLIKFIEVYENSSWFGFVLKYHTVSKCIVVCLRWLNVEYWQSCISVMQWLFSSRFSAIWVLIMRLLLTESRKIAADLDLSWDTMWWVKLIVVSLKWLNVEYCRSCVSVMQSFFSFRFSAVWAGVMRLPLTRFIKG